MHSEITRDTGSTATVTGRLRYCMRGAMLRFSKLETPEGLGLSILKGCCASRFMICLPGSKIVVQVGNKLAVCCTWGTKLAGSRQNQEAYSSFLRRAAIDE